MNQFHKRALTVAVTSALGIGVAQQAEALTLGEPGEALLIPYAVYDSAQQLDTLVGVATGSPGQYGLDPLPNPSVANAGHYPTAPSIDPTKLCPSGSSNTQALHLYFYDDKSNHRADIKIPATCDDFVRVDWGAIVKGTCGVCTTSFPSLDGVPGYIVLSSEWANLGWGGTNNPNDFMPLWGQTYLIQGNWASEAFIPTLPLRDSQLAFCGGGQTVATWQCTDVARAANGGVPKDVSPLVSGMQLDNNDGDNGDAAVFSLRYFLDPALAGAPSTVLPAGVANKFVIWLDTNSSSRSSLSTLVYNSAEVPVSSSVSLPNELNVINLYPDPADCDPTKSTNLCDGVYHSETDKDAGGGQPIVNTGFVLFAIPETGDSQAGSGPAHAGVAFSLNFLGAGANPGQVQTELAHERGVVEGGVNF
jgi:hypothetical protein